jgi:hypothetical protein
VLVVRAEMADPSEDEQPVLVPGMENDSVLSALQAPRCHGIRDMVRAGTFQELPHQAQRALVVSDILNSSEAFWHQRTHSCSDIEHEHACLRLMGAMRERVQAMVAEDIRKLILNKGPEVWRQNPWTSQHELVSHCGAVAAATDKGVPTPTKKEDSGAAKETEEVSDSNSEGPPPLVSDSEAEESNHGGVNRAGGARPRPPSSDSSVSEVD